MDVLIACEYSGVVRDAFISKGCNAISCDLLPTDKPGPHYEGNLFDIIDLKWDFIGAHPPCTYLTNSGVRWLYNKDGSKNTDRWIKLEEAVNFFNAIKSKIKIGYLENPIPHKYARDGFCSVVTGKWVEGIGKYSHTFQPYDHGHSESKRTCLWLKGLPRLNKSNDVKQEYLNLPRKESNKIHYASPSVDRWKIRSTTYSGVAKAMAEQWA